MANIELTPARTPDASGSPRKSYAMLQSPLEPLEPAIALPTEPLHDPKPAETDDATAEPKAATPAAPVVNKILFLDGIRGLAAMLVVCQHVSYIYGVSVGQPAVDMFFVLSAFLLTMIFEKKARTLLKERASYRRWGWALLDYFVRRFLRVYPLFFVVTIILWAMPLHLKERYFVFHHPEDFNVVKVLIFQFDYRYHVYWTLPLEIMYYFIIPVFVAVVLALKKFWFVPMLPLCYWIANASFYWPRGDHMPLKQHLPTFLCGSLAAIVYSKIDQWITKRQFKFRWFHMLALRVIEYGALLMLMSTLFTGLVFTYVFTNPIKGPGNKFVSSNVSTIIVCEMLLPGAISSLLEWSLLRYAGKVSFSMYLLHSFVIYDPWLTRQEFYDRFWILWGLLFLLSTASYYAVEYPSQLVAGRIGKAIKKKDAEEKKRATECLPQDEPSRV